jgi:hypothetical protein
LEILRRPKFLIEFEQKEPFCRYANLKSDSPNPSLEGVKPASLPAYWIRIKVTNDGRKVAENCEGKLVEVIENKDKEERLFQPFDPVILHWVGREDYYPITINKGGYEYLDVVFTVKNNPLANIYCDTRRSRGIKTGLPAGEYLLNITILSGNMKPASEKYRLIWNGKWGEVRMTMA